MEEMNIYRNLNDVSTLKSDECVKETISHICKDILENTEANGISIYIFNKKERALIPFIELGDDIKYTKIFTKINMDTKELEIVKQEGTELYHRDRIENLINRNKHKHHELEKSFENNIISMYKLSVDNEFIGSLNIIHKGETVYNSMPYDYMNGVCKLISIILRSWLLNKEVILENQRRTIIENELDEYLEKSTDLVCIYNENQKIINLSSSWTKILGWTKEELLNTGIYDYIYFEDLKELRDINKYLSSIDDKKNRKTEIKTRYLCKNGTYKWIHWNIEYSEKISGYFVTGKDITEKIVEEERQKNLEERIELEAMKSDFFTNMSHEFKTPLNIILGTMQVMEKCSENYDEVSNDDLQRYLKNIKQNSYRLLKLVNNLTDISKMDIGYYNICLSKNNIVSIVEDICLSVVEHAKNKGIEIIFDTEFEEIEMACDPDAIERVVLNLLSNAIKYSLNENSRILVNISDDKEFVFVSVKDNGRGIPKDKLEIIFDRFGQVNADCKRRYESSGIGLYLVQSIIKLHGGNIKVDSVENEGSTFTFALPKNLKINDEVKNVSSFEKNNSSIEKCKIEFSDIYN
ncbi:PAS domain-containing sensor histidine kinase [Terrisporobacter mayombei]|uniref:histidine kinase n=1 Tax=Terrisporobacter mayombei TaxID=1541 RepID=A0ABY9Q108_9FIRM|nr:PAS domain-containing sensor histidine kinase [Terrisporobacter mayombei]MCC3866854.1 PAS domain-containing sensor histidine kinase [Terrisporobacter mayombei]WMT81094.1 Adaptive-response sensory-kinase SasA [Terrisporobacter mayombei]